MLDKTWADTQTISNSYIWALPLPDNKHNTYCLKSYKGKHVMQMNKNVPKINNFLVKL